MHSIVAPAVDECTKRPSEFFGEFFFADGAEDGHGGAVGLQLAQAPVATREMPLERGVFIGRQLAFDEIGQQPHDVGAIPH